MTEHKWCAHNLYYMSLSRSQLFFRLAQVVQEKLVGPLPVDQIPEPLHETSPVVLVVQVVRVLPKVQSHERRNSFHKRKASIVTFEDFDLAFVVRCEKDPARSKVFFGGAAEVVFEAFPGAVGADNHAVQLRLGVKRLAPRRYRCKKLLVVEGLSRKIH